MHAKEKINKLYLLNYTTAFDLWKRSPPVNSFSFNNLLLLVPFGLGIKQYIPKTELHDLERLEAV